MLAFIQQRIRQSLYQRLVVHSVPVILVVFILLGTVYQHQSWSALQTSYTQHIKLLNTVQGQSGASTEPQILPPALAREKAWDAYISQLHTTHMYHMMAVAGACVGLTMALLFLWSRAHITRPLKKLQRAMTGAKESGTYTRVAWHHPDELGLTIKAHNDMMMSQSQHMAHMHWTIKRGTATTQHLQNRQADLVQTSKMEAIGTLSGGIAHELNTPLQYLGDNLNFLIDSVMDLCRLARNCEAALTQPDLHETLSRAITECDLDFLLEEAPAASRAVEDGLQHISNIVEAMRGFAQTSPQHMQDTHVNKVIETAVTTEQEHWAQTATLSMELDQGLPQVLGHEGALNQALQHLLHNASDAIEQKFNGQPGGEIKLCTLHTPTAVKVIIQDNGCGIASQNLPRVFDPFFTTKPVGTGTGQGLTLVHDTIVNGHQGQVEISSNEGLGTIVILTLPPAQQQHLVQYRTAS